MAGFPAARHGAWLPARHAARCGSFCRSGDLGPDSGLRVLRPILPWRPVFAVMSQAGSDVLPCPQPLGLWMEEESWGEPQACAGTCHHSVLRGLMPEWHGSSSLVPSGSRGEAACDFSLFFSFFFFLAYSTCSTLVVLRCPAPRVLGQPCC